MFKNYKLLFFSLLCITWSHADAMTKDGLPTAPAAPSEAQAARAVVSGTPVASHESKELTVFNRDIFKKFYDQAFSGVPSSPEDEKMLEKMKAVSQDTEALGLCFWQAANRGLPASLKYAIDNGVDVRGTHPRLTVLEILDPTMLLPTFLLYVYEQRGAEVVLNMLMPPGKETLLYLVITEWDEPIAIKFLLYLTFKLGGKKALQKLIVTFGQDRMTALHCAVMCGEDEKAQAIIEALAQADCDLQEVFAIRDEGERLFYEIAEDKKTREKYQALAERLIKEQTERRLNIQALFDALTISGAAH